jgi:hypothetical protein
VQMSSNSRKTRVIDLDAFNAARTKLQTLVDDNPLQAISEARQLPSDRPLRGLHYTSLKACILVDAGSQAKNKDAIEEGIALFKQLSAKSPREASHHYSFLC